MQRLFTFLKLMVLGILSYLTTSFEKLATAIPTLPEMVKFKVQEATANFAAKVHALFMLPTLMRK